MQVYGQSAQYPVVVVSQKPESVHLVKLEDGGVGVFIQEGMDIRFLKITGHSDSDSGESWTRIEVLKENGGVNFNV